MAILNRKEDKIQAVLDRLPKEYTHEQFVEMFIKLFSKDWGKIKAAYIKQSQDKEPGTVINMPNPKSYLQQVLNAYLSKAKETKAIPAKEDTPTRPENESLASSEIEVEDSPKPVKAVVAKKSAKIKDDTTRAVPEVKAVRKKKEL